MFNDDLERIAREAKALLTKLRTELRAGQMSEPVTGSIHPPAFLESERKEVTDYRIAFALGLAPALSITRVKELGDEVTDKAANSLACRIRQAITGEDIHIMTEDGEVTITDGALLTDANPPNSPEFDAQIAKINEDLAKENAVPPDPSLPTRADADPLPEGFPGFAALKKADVTTWGQVRELSDGGLLTDVAGIGPDTAEKIQSALKA